MKNIIFASIFCLFCITNNAYADTKSLKCLTDAIYFEARGEPIIGKLAVANVVMNRVKHKDYPRNVCAVTQQKTKRTCQFSYHCQKNKTIKDRDIYIFSRNLALFALTNTAPDVTQGALFFHNKNVNPKWTSKMKKTIKIKNHIFYREYV